MSLLAKIKNLNRKRIENRRLKQVETAALECGADIVVSTPPHCMYIAKCIKYVVSSNGRSCYINAGEKIPLTRDGVIHIVICPQLYDFLPSGYIAYQMEQTLSSSWFDQKYIEKLSAAAAILDYSESNVIELKKILRRDISIFHCPIPLVRQIFPASSKKFDVAFYGNVNGSARRAVFLSEICNQFQVNLIHGKHGDDLYADLSTASLVVNIHYYENAPLETTRIMECLSLGLPVVSEAARDIESYPGIQAVVDFSEEGDVESMVVKIREILSNMRKTPGMADVEECQRLFFAEFKAALTDALIVGGRR